MQNYMLMEMLDLEKVEKIVGIVEFDLGYVLGFQKLDFII